MTATLELVGVSKSYGLVRALTDVQLSLSPGEVHVLAGENGSGKSTLAKVCAGFVRPDRGRVRLDGREQAPFAAPLAAIRAGVLVVSQEGTLVPSLSVAENIFLGGRFERRRGHIDWRGTRRAAEAVLGTIGVAIDPSQSVEELSPAEQQLVELARAMTLSGEAETRVLILDEITSALDGRHVESVYSLVHRLQAASAAVLFVSHRADEMLRLGDRFTVLRHGTVAAAGVPRDDVDERWLFTTVLGEDVGETPVAARRRATGPARPAGAGSSGLQVEHLSDRDGRVRDVSLHARPREILGIAGRVGSGQTELMEMIAAVRPRHRGSVLVDGNPVETARAAVRSGIGLVPEDRRGKGLVATLSVGENMVLAKRATDRSFGGVRGRRRGRMVAEHWRERLAIRSPGIDTPVTNLSGGNQQKVLMARWMLVEPRVLLLNEPTRGIDLRGRAEIHRLIEELADAGACVVMAASDVGEVLAVADRVVVLRDGSVVGEVRPADGPTELELLNLMHGIDGDERSTG